MEINEGLAEGIKRVLEEGTEFERHGVYEVMDESHKCQTIVVKTRFKTNGNYWAMVWRRRFSWAETMVEGKVRQIRKECDELLVGQNLEALDEDIAGVHCRMVNMIAHEISTGDRSAWLDSVKTKS